MIVTVPRVGYRLVAPVRPVDADRGGPPLIAVLPFANHGSIAEDGYFADGVVDDIITALSRFKTFAVVSRGSTLRAARQGRRRAHRGGGARRPLRARRQHPPHGRPPAGHRAAARCRERRPALGRALRRRARRRLLVPGPHHRKRRRRHRARRSARPRSSAPAASRPQTSMPTTSSSGRCRSSTTRASSAIPRPSRSCAGPWSSIPASPCRLPMPPGSTRSASRCARRRSATTTPRLPSSSPAPRSALGGDDPLVRAICAWVLFRVDWRPSGARGRSPRRRGQSQPCRRAAARRRRRRHATAAMPTKIFRYHARAYELSPGAPEAYDSLFGMAAARAHHGQQRGGDRVGAQVARDLQRPALHLHRADRRLRQPRPHGRGRAPICARCAKSART